jgi:hypothetical protein
MEQRYATPGVTENVESSGFVAPESDGSGRLKKGDGIRAGYVTFRSEERHTRAATHFPITWTWGGTETSLRARDKWMFCPTYSLLSV